MVETTPAKSNLIPVLCHLSMLLGYFIPLGNIIGPAVLWMWKRKEDPDVDHHGREALNFQISVTIYMLVGFAILFTHALVLKFIPPSEMAVTVLKMFPLFGLPLLAVMLGNFILMIIAAVKAGKGVRYLYPFSLRFVK